MRFVSRRNASSPAWWCGSRSPSMPAETHVAQGPIGPDEVYRILRERLAEILEIDEDRIKLESSFTQDLDADSLALIELVEAPEEELGDPRARAQPADSQPP